MDEKQFYSESTAATGAYFKSLIAAWTQKGGSTQWGAGGIGLRLTINGRDMGICFVAPAFAGKKDRIELSLTTLAKQVGAALCEALKSALKAAAGSSMKGTSMVSILEPGELPPTKQKTLTASFDALM